ncbi:four helix bundle protein [Kaistella jeonii]|uniref:four helix bundle protein n=1 Tax=Kaistella jeonii TaxID=266749 RepID=UPI00068D490F|nr:four helix bundle protein [Kaistella jeonii]SFB81629.1 23S rRNA-intervening sequence protein [Kaistella jeonii]VEI96135.1 Uncharacterised protein [Kaistella jeonii]
MGSIISFKDLIVWQKIHFLVFGTYNFTMIFPKRGSFCVNKSDRKSSSFLAANTAEGLKKKTLAN